MSLWGKPRVEVLTVATTGRFTADAVQWIETHNASGGTPSSALNQTKVTGRRSSLAIMASSDWVQTNGLGLALCSAR
jgi:hypothetical protein